MTCVVFVSTFVISLVILDVFGLWAAVPLGFVCAMIALGAWSYSRRALP